METTTSFDLNQAIERWRGKLGQSPALRPENLNELESHLRDSVESLQGHGLSAEEAFLVAARRLGAYSPLAGEFAKVNGTAVWLDRLFWIMLGYQVWIFISGVISLVARNAMFFGLTGVGYDFNSYGRTIPVALFALINLAGFAGSLTLCWWLLCRKGQRFGQWLGGLLHRRVTWVLAFMAFYLLSLSVSLVNGAMRALFMRSIDQESLPDIILSMSISSAITPLITTAVFVGLTLFLAHKRFRPNQA